jgi:hypothetical protein
MKTLIAFLMLWIGSETDYNTNIPHPVIKQVSETTLAKMNVSDDKIHALYDPSTKTIYLKDTFNNYNVFDKGLLLREVLHYVYDMNNVYETIFNCVAESNIEIYSLQKKYLIEVHGVAWTYDSNHLESINSCN